MAAPRACTVTETLENGAEKYQNLLCQNSGKVKSLHNQVSTQQKKRQLKTSKSFASFLLALVPPLLSLTTALKTASPVPSVELWSLVPERGHTAEQSLFSKNCVFKF